MINEERLSNATLADLSVWFTDRTLTPTDYLEFCFGQIERLNSKVNAVLNVYIETAHLSAKASTERYKYGRPHSEIDGMPIGVKANISVRGYPCHGGIKAYSDTISSQDAEIVHKLRCSGAIIIGSLNMEEGALGAQTDNLWFGKTFNPIKEGYTAGGSSGGSAAAVSAGMMPAALGTDTMGSVRIPSSYCGIVGFKPHPGTYSNAGIMPLSTSLDTVGTHTRTVSDAVMIYKAVTGFKGNLEARAPKLLAPFDMSKSEIQPAIVNAFENCLEHLDTDMTAPILTEYDYSRQRRAGLIVSEVEGAKFHQAKDFKYSDGFSEHFKSMLVFGTQQTSEKIEEAYKRIHEAHALGESLFINTSALIAPTAPQTAFRFGDAVPSNQADFTAFANFAKLPAISLPMGLDDNGLPMGLQLMTKSGRDRALLGIALSVEAKLIKAGIIQSMDV